MSDAEFGKFTYWNEERGFGFIAPDVGGENVFAHVSRGNCTPHKGQRVEFSA